MSKDESDKNESHDDTDIQDTITNHPKIIEVIQIDKMSLVKEHKPLLNVLQYNYLTAKEIHTKVFPKQSLRTTYRNLSKLVDQGLIIEVGFRKTEGSRVTETLYGPFAKVIFYEGPQIMEDWRNEDRKNEIKLMYLMIKEKLELDIDFDTFYDYALEYLEDQDTVSSELLKIAEEDDEILEVLQTIPTQRISHLLFMATNLSIITKRSKKFTD